MQALCLHRRGVRGPPNPHVFSPNRIVWGSLLRKKVGRSGWMGGPRQRGWAPIGLPSCLLSGLLGRMGGPQQRGWAPIVHVSFLGSWVGWVGRGNGARLPLGSLHVSFLGSWVGWVGRGNGAGLLLGSLHVSFLGSWAAESDGRAAATRLGFLLDSLRIFASGSDGWWVGRGNGAGLPLSSLHVSFLGGPRQRGWAPIGLPSCFLSDGWAAATGPGFHWAPFMFPFWAPWSDG